MSLKHTEKYINKLLTYCFWIIPISQIQTFYPEYAVNDEMDKVQWCIDFDEKYYKTSIYHVMFLDEVDDDSWCFEVVVGLFDEIWWHVCGD